MILESEIQDWKRFSDSLRKDDKAFFEAMMDACRLYASYAGAACRPIPAEAMFMSILFHHQKLLSELKTQVEKLQNEKTITSPTHQTEVKTESTPLVT